MNILHAQIVFRNAVKTDLPEIMSLFTLAIKNMQSDGINQWNEKYPASRDIEYDMENGQGYVLEAEGIIFVYGAVVRSGESAYENLRGKWLGSDSYLVIHRLVTNPEFRRNNLAAQFFKKVEEMGKNSGFSSIRVDTNSDNMPMQRFLKKNGFSHCGEIIFQGSPKLAYEKLFL